jgi:Predicted hydrolases or acyltransferases (alpha/beta hydrolase superfamily)
MSHHNSASPIELYHESYGRGNPLLCIHGFGASLYSWRNFIEPFAHEYQLILIDLKGCGKSPKPDDTKYSTQDHADLLYQFIMAHDLRNLTLIGNSFGGALSLLLSLMLADAGESARLKSLVLIDAGAYKEFIPAYLNLLSIPLVSFGVYLIPSRFAVRAILSKAYYDQSKITEEQISAYAAPIAAPGGKHALRETGRQLVPSNFDDLIKRYKDITVPTLIIWGRQDKVIPLKVGQMLNRDILNSTLKIIEECGHAPQEEKPEETVPLVLEFLHSL